MNDCRDLTDPVALDSASAQLTLMQRDEMEARDQIECPCFGPVDYDARIRLTIFAHGDRVYDNIIIRTHE